MCPKIFKTPCPGFDPVTPLEYYLIIARLRANFCWLMKHKEINVTINGKKPNSTGYFTN